MDEWLGWVVLECERLMLSSRMMFCRVVSLLDDWMATSMDGERVVWL